MLDAPLTTGVTDIEGRGGGAVGAGRSSHATVSIATVRESRTERLTTHLRRDIESGFVQTTCPVSRQHTIRPKGRSPDTRRYTKTAITSGRDRAAAGRASLNRVALLQSIALRIVSCFRAWR